MAERPRRRWHPGMLVVLFALISLGCRSTPIARAGNEVVLMATSVASEPSASPPTVYPSPNQVRATEPTTTSSPARATVLPSPLPEPTPAVTIADLLLMSSLSETECPEDVRAGRVACSIATLPRDVDSHEPGETVEIMVALVDNGDPNNVGPVVFLQGGPGVGSVTQADNFVGADHDLLFVDQRGTGYSTPTLKCPEVDVLWEGQYSDDPAVRLPDGEVFLKAAYADCGRRLTAEGIDFNLFNTRSAAVDIELLRQLFGYEEWSIWGSSYGTRLGLTIMRDHPDGVRAAVLDSVVPFEVDFFAAIPENGMRAIAALDQACDNARCSSDHGDFMSVLSELVLELNREPVAVIATMPITGKQWPFRVGGEQLIDLVFTQLYSTRSLGALPRQVSRASFGGLEEMVAAFVSRREPTQFDLSLGLYYTTWCREEFPFYDESIDDDLLSELEEQFGTAVAGALSSDGIAAYCDIFEVTPAPAVENHRLVSPIHTLVFAGAFDPITPPAWSLQVADSLSNSVYVEMSNHGHGMATACPMAIRLAFLINPTAALDTSCADQAGGPEFE
jgi:pimeloyl-ACP methyl ester carboxylesterase